MAEKREKIRLVTGDVRLSYPSVFEPKQQQDGSEKYEVSLLVPKSDKRTISALKKAIMEAMEDGATRLWGGSKAGAKVSFRDGDEEKPDDPNYEGMMFFNARGKYAPRIVDRALNPVIDREKVYPGVWARVSVEVYPYAAKDQGGKKVISKGVAFGLGNIQIVKDDTRFGGGGVNPEDEFGEIEDNFGFEDGMPF